jgi:hypothetical protein
LQGTYQPEIDSVQKQQAALPGQQQAAEAGLTAQKDQGFTDILNQARSRGTGVAFGGIPLQEQSKYLSTTYLPAEANLKSSYNQQATSLQDAINSIYEKRNNQALGIQQFQQQQEEAARQFNENLAFQKAQAAQQAAAARAASASSYSPSYSSGGGGSAASTSAAAKGTDPTAQAAYNFIQSKAKDGQGALVSDFNAALKYYNKTGNQPDFVKLTLYKQLYPDLFGNVNFAPANQINTAYQRAVF